MTVLAATDFSDRSKTAVRRAALEAARRHTRLVVLHCVDTPQEKWEYLDETPPDMTDRIERAGLEHLESFVRETLPAEHHRLVDECRIEIAHAVSGILEASDPTNMELIVLGAAGAGAVTQFFLGSTAEEVVRAADLPVMVVPTDEPSDAPDTILAPIDLSECSRVSLKYAIEWADREEADLKLLHVTSLPTGAMELMNREPTDADVETHRQFTSDQLRDFLSDVDFGDVAHEELLRFGAPHREIEQTLDEEEVDLVVMGTHGHRGVQRLFLGSTAAKVLRQLSRPVVTVRHSEER